MKTFLEWIGPWALVATLLTVTSHSAAQGAPADASTDAGLDAAPDVDAAAAAEAYPDDLPGAASDAERILRIRHGIGLDKAKLHGLRIELRARSKWFEDLAAGMTEVTLKLNEKKEALEKLDPAGDPDEANELETRIADLQEDYDLYNRQTDLALTVEKKTKEEFEALVAKIDNDERSLAELTGHAPIARSAAATQPAPDRSVVEPESAVPVPMLVPGLPQPSTPKRTADRPSDATAAQLRAQKVVEEKQKELEQARFEVENYVERKRALETQLEIENDIAKHETDEIENLELALETWQKRLDAAAEKGDGERAERGERAVKGLAGIIAEARRATAVRAEYQESLQKRLERIEEEGIRVNSVADERRKDLERAERSLFWLESPLHPRNVANWALKRGPRILLVIGMIALLLLLLQVSARRVARTFIRGGTGARSVGTGRADTLAFSFRSAARVALIAIGVMLVLQEAGLDIRTVLGGAAIFGVAIAFGAQDLMRDYFTGFLILLEDQYQLGDLVTIEGITGTVESVNMRVTVLRDLEGRVHFVPNGNIKSVTNRTYGWGRPVFEVPVRYDEDVDRVMETLVEVATGLMTDPDWKPFVTGQPEMLGVDKFTDRGIVIKFMVKTQPDKLFAVRREMLRRVAKRFNELGIQITVPTVIVKQDT